MRGKRFDACMVRLELLTLRGKKFASSLAPFSMETALAKRSSSAPMMFDRPLRAIQTRERVGYNLRMDQKCLLAVASMQDVALSRSR